MAPEGSDVIVNRRLTPLQPVKLEIITPARTTHAAKRRDAARVTTPDLSFLCVLLLLYPCISYSFENV